MTIYADSVFAVNALSNALLLYSYCFFYGSKPKHGRLAAASAAGGCYAVLEAVLDMPRILRAGVLAGLVYIALGRSGIIRNTARVMLMCFVIEGITLAVVSAMGASAELARGGAVLFASEPVCAAIYISAYPMFFIASKLRERRKKYIRLRIKYRGKEAVTEVLRDSGNLLRYHDRPVVMVAWEAVSDLFDYKCYSELKEKTEAYAIYETISGAGIVPIIEGAECEADGFKTDAAVAVVERKFKGRYFGIAGDNLRGN